MNKVTENEKINKHTMGKNTLICKNKHCSNNEILSSFVLTRRSVIKIYYFMKHFRGICLVSLKYISYSKNFQNAVYL